MGNQNKKETYIKMSKFVKNLSLVSAIAVSAYGHNSPSAEGENESIVDHFKKLAESKGYTVQSACNIFKLGDQERIGQMFFAQKETPDYKTPVETLWSAQVAGLDSFE